MLLLQAALSSATCTRQTLLATRDAFFKAGAVNNTQGIKLAAEAKIALNNIVTELGSTPFTNLTNFSEMKVEAVDTEACQVATFRVSASQILSTRLKVDDVGTIWEVEFLQAVRGDQFFNPPGFPSTTPSMWTTKQNPGTPPNIPATWTPIGGTPAMNVNKAACKAGAGVTRLLTRKELMYIVSTYQDGLKGDPWDSCILGGSSCPRNENGNITTPNCAEGAGTFNYLSRGRRYVVDTDTSIILGAFFFDFGGTPPNSTSIGPGAPVDPDAGADQIKLFLHEYFKVEAGALVGIYAPMKRIPGPQATAKIFEGEQ
jgi:hypothetical protein